MSAVHIRRFGVFEFPPVDLTQNQRIRLWSVDPRKLPRSRYAIAAALFDGQILAISGDEQTSDLDDIPRWMTCYCLSKWEEGLLRSRGVKAIALSDFDIDVSDLVARLQRLREVESSCRMVEGFDLSAGISFREYVSLLCNFRVERKLQYKSSLDGYFFDSPMRCHSECFLAESLGDPIVALDVNSMFPDILINSLFPDPSRLTYGKPSVAEVLELKNGLFDCILRPRGLNTILYDHLPFFAGFDHEAMPFKIDGEIRKKLHACEIEAYKDLFEIEILEGVYSRNPISHPLANMAAIMFTQKGVNIAAKSVMTTMHASTMRFSTTKKRIDIDPDVPMTASIGRYLTLNGDGHSEIYDTQNQTNIYSLTSTVFAHARVHMFKLIRAVIESGYDLAYTNIDSMHVICRHGSTVSDLLTTLGSQVGHGLGLLKIEAVADAGVWLSPGVYQLRLAETIVKEASISNGPHLTMPVFDAITGLVELRHVLAINLISWQKRLRNARWERCDLSDAMTDTASEMLEFNGKPKIERLINRFWRSQNN